MKEELSIFDEVTENNKYKGILFFYYATSGIDKPFYSLLPIISLRENDYIAICRSDTSQAIWEKRKNEFNYSDKQVIFYDLIENTAIMIENVLKNFKNTEVIVINMHNIKVMRDVCEKNGFSFYGNKMDILPDKRYLNQCIDSSRDISKDFSNEISYVPFPKNYVSVPKGYTCYSKKELEDAYNLMKSSGLTSFAIKTCNSLGGVLLWFVKNDDEFELIANNIAFEYENFFEMQASFCVIIQECIDTFIENNSEIFKKNSTINYGFNIVGGKIAFECTNALINHDFYLSMTDNPILPQEFVEKIRKQAEYFADYTKDLFNHMFHLEFYFTKDLTSFYLFDLNIRFTDSDHILFFLEKYKLPRLFIHYKVSNFSYDKLIKLIDEKKLIFDKQTKKGIIPEAYFVEPENNSKVFIVGPDMIEIKKLYLKFISILNEYE